MSAKFAISGNTVAVIDPSETKKISAAMTESFTASKDLLTTNPEV